MMHATPSTPCDAPARYRIIIAGHLDSDWSLYFDGLDVTPERRTDGTVVTVISGIMQDQAALHGILSHVRDVGLCLLAVEREEVRV